MGSTCSGRADSPVPLNKASPGESKAEFSALLMDLWGWQGAVPLKEQHFPHPSPGHHSWEVRLGEAWS